MSIWSRRVASLRRSVGTGQRKISQVMGMHGLLDFTTLRPVLPWRAFWNLWTVSLIFQIFGGHGKSRIIETMDPGVSLSLLTKCHISKCKLGFMRWLTYTGDNLCLDYTTISTMSSCISVCFPWVWELKITYLSTVIHVDHIFKR